MNQKLLQDVAFLMRKYYDDRGARLESYAEQMVALCTNKEQLLMVLNQESIMQARKADELFATESFSTDWEKYKKYIAEEIEFQVNKKLNTIKIYMTEK